MPPYTMITVEEAREIIEKNVGTLKPVASALQDAAGKILAGDIYAGIDIPPFPQSSMDGYAFLFSEWKRKQKLIVEGEIAAGSPEKVFLSPGKAVRIFTGAVVPPGADTVIIQEKAKIQNGELVIEDELLVQGANVRPQGSEMKAGQLALAKGSLLSPAAIGFLASIGLTEVRIIPNPAVCLIITGQELQKPGMPLAYGQVYESNSFTLTAALNQLDIQVFKTFRADDNLEIVSAMLEEALQLADIVLLTGGISAGDYDFVLSSTANCGVTPLFHKIKQRPGKPLYFGKRNNKLVFGLPGNPASVLTCFYEYVLKTVEILTKRKIGLQKIQAPLSKPFRKSAFLTHFLKAFYNGTSVTVLDAQESYRLSSFARANCLVVINGEVTECKEGDLVEVHLLPV